MEIVGINPNIQISMMASIATRIQRSATTTRAARNVARNAMRNAISSFNAIHAEKSIAATVNVINVGAIARSSSTAQAVAANMPPRWLMDIVTNAAKNATGPRNAINVVTSIASMGPAIIAETNAITTSAAMTTATSTAMNIPTSARSTAQAAISYLSHAKRA
jgi:hypothetical protein